MTTTSAASARDELTARLLDLDEALQEQACELTLIDFEGDEYGEHSAEVFDTFARNLEQRRGALVIAWLDRDLEALRQAAHGARVGAGSFGLHAAAELAKRLERALAFERPPREVLERLAALLLVIEPSVVQSHRPGPHAWRREALAG